MPLYLVIHTPRAAPDEMVHAPTRLRDLASASKDDDVTPRWLRTWSPDLSDERIFSLWEAHGENEIADALERFGFLNDMEAELLRVSEWGPEDVFAAQGE